jgi:hypothetical protein
MIWLTWRQFRTQAVVVLTAVGFVAVVLAFTGARVAALHDADAGEFLNRFAGSGMYKTLYFVSAAAVYAIPAVVGAFWGAPLIARELESGTHRLAWTQSVSRNRWLATKLGMIALAATTAALLSLVVTWWCTPIDTTVNHIAPDGGFFNITRLSGVLLGARGAVPVGYTVLALMIGVTAGLVVRRAVPAMALTFTAVIAVQIFMPLVVQPHLLAPERVTTAITSANVRGLTIADDGTIEDILVRVSPPGAWVTTNHTIDEAGNEVGSIPVTVADCTPPAAARATSAGASQKCFDQLAAAGYRQEVEYQPARRYWPLQWSQTGILLTGALLLTGFCFWRIRHT